MANNSFTNAKNAKEDEFYTQYEDIQAEINSFLEFDPNTFKGKTILLPCDDPEWSNFTKFFAQNFERLGLKKLISTSYAAKAKSKKYSVEINLFQNITTLEESNVKYDVKKTNTHGKIYVLDKDRDNSGHIDIDDLNWDYLDGDGDFRSNEVTALRDEADIIVTNPPFSMFREFVSWIMETKKRFLIIGSQNNIVYKEIFPLVMKNKIWLGCHTGDMAFKVPDCYEPRATRYWQDDNGQKWRSMGNICWYTNLEHGRRHRPLPLMTFKANLKHSKHKEILERGYPKYDNYDAIEVSFTDAIPSDYTGVMGVPITFLDKYCPEQFTIVGITRTWFGGASKTYPMQTQIDPNGKETRVSKLNDQAAEEIFDPLIDKPYYVVDNKLYKAYYQRILIKSRKEV